MNNNIKSYNLKYFIICILVGIMFNYFFLFNHLGYSVLIYNCILLTLFYFKYKDLPFFNRKVFTIISIAIIILSTPYLRFEHNIFRYFNVIIFPLLYGYLISYNNDFNIFSIIKSTLSGTFIPFCQMNKFFVVLSKFFNKKSNIYLKIIIGILLAVFIMIIIVPLLLSSDSIFKFTVSKLIEHINFNEVAKFIFKLITFLFVASYIFAQLFYAPNNTANTKKQSAQKKFDLIISIAFLLTINIVYILFSYIQIKYLFIGKGTLPEGITYSEYAREGFFQLVFVTFINVLVIVIFNYFKQSKLIVNILLVITVICTYIMCFSAFYKMKLYELTYGYTLLRLLVYLFIIGEVLLLIPLFLGALKSNFKYLELSIIIIFVYYLCLNFINMDGYIAYKNINHFKATNKLDTQYLESLSIDALPEIYKLIEIDDEKKSNLAKNIIEDSYSRLTETNYHWFEKNLSQIKAKKLYELIINSK